MGTNCLDHNLHSADTVLQRMQPPEVKSLRGSHRIGHLQVDTTLILRGPRLRVPREKTDKVNLDSQPDDSDTDLTPLGSQHQIPQGTSDTNI